MAVKNRAPTYRLSSLIVHNEAKKDELARSRLSAVNPTRSKMDNSDLRSVGTHLGGQDPVNDTDRFLIDKGR